MLNHFLLSILWDTQLEQGTAKGRGGDSNEIVQELQELLTFLEPICSTFTEQLLSV